MKSNKKGVDIMAYSIFTIANWFLSKEAMTNKKLQKLAYYAEAWSQTLLKRSIIKDSEFEAWAHGSVSSKLYDKYKENKWIDIEKFEEKVDIADEKDLELLESVWYTYGDMTANALEAQTHSESPWKCARARADVKEGERSEEVIGPEDMKKYYLSVYAGDD